MGRAKAAAGDVNQLIELELKFRIPDSTLRGVTQEMSRQTASAQHQRMQATYFDTPQRHLASAGLAWRVRKEGRRWVQTVKAPMDGGIARWEHEVQRPEDTVDASLHAGTPVGERLLKVLREVETDGSAVEACYRTDMQRRSRLVRVRGAVVEVALDQGHIVADSQTLSVNEIEFELVSGSLDALLGLAQRWGDRFALQWDPRSKAERGDRLARGQSLANPQRARNPVYDKRASPDEAFAAVMDECMGQITGNAIALLAGDPAQRDVCVHQLRVGIRRLRSACRAFRGWVETPPDTLLQSLTTLFQQLGQVRERDVWSERLTGVLNEAGLPALVFPAAAPVPDPAALVSDRTFQRCLLDWTRWRVHRFAPKAELEVESTSPAHFKRLALKRLKRWHRRLLEDAMRLSDLEEAALHDLRKRVKRQRYAAEFFLPVLGRRACRHYLAQLAPLQDAMGELNDLLTARDACRPLTEHQPAASFAMGWIAARLATTRDDVERAFGKFVKAPLPGG